jgi:surface carbohydrate biosynthesis protein
VTGNPRLDLLQQDLRGIYDSEAHRYRKEHNQYILINTNFTSANPFNEDTLEKSDSSKITYENQLYEQFIESIKYLQENLNRFTYVIRLHPSGNNKEYRSKFQSDSNIKLRHEENLSRFEFRKPPRERLFESQTEFAA